MKMRLIFLVVFLTAMTAGVADAEWVWWKSKPQPFQVFDDYVIAAGTKDSPVSVRAFYIQKALQDGKEIRLRYVEVRGDLQLHGEIRKDVYFLHTTFTGRTYFS